MSTVQQSDKGLKAAACYPGFLLTRESWAAMNQTLLLVDRHFCADGGKSTAMQTYLPTPDMLHRLRTNTAQASITTSSPPPSPSCPLRPAPAPATPPRSASTCVGQSSTILSHPRPHLTIPSLTSSSWATALPVDMPHTCRVSPLPLRRTTARLTTPAPTTRPTCEMC